MTTYPISDWDDAYANGPHIANADDYPAAWEEPAAAFRDKMSALGRAELDVSYGPSARHKIDFFLPEGTPKGIVIFIHGGYWFKMDHKNWSHLAQGSLEAGYVVAMPTYRLCPDVRIAEITVDIGRAIELIAERYAGPIRLTGHSAGGHLAVRMLCEGAPLDAKVQQRIVKTVSLSGVHDLRPIMHTQMNDILAIDAAEAQLESPTVLVPHQLSPLTCWVGANERPEFIRLNAVLADMWKSFNMVTKVIEEPGRNHFNVIEGLVDLYHPLTQELLAD